MNKESGFTLVELLTAIAIIGALAGISIRSFKSYQGKATYQVAYSLLSDGRSAIEAALVEPDAVFAPVPLLVQSVPGKVTDAAAAPLLPGLMVPKSTKLRFTFDPACLDNTCISAYLQTNHCAGSEYVTWARQGDGTEFLTENISGSGCP